VPFPVASLICNGLQRKSRPVLARHAGGFPIANATRKGAERAKINPQKEKEAS
jgi:hypothetical protein